MRFMPLTVFMIGFMVAYEFALHLRRIDGKKFDEEFDVVEDKGIMLFAIIGFILNLFAGISGL